MYLKPIYVSFCSAFARLKFVTALGMANFDCNKNEKKFTACLREGLIHEWTQA